VGFRNAVDLFSVYAGQAEDLRPWLTGAEINEDGNLRLQYLAGLALNNSQEGGIYEQMLGYRRFPTNLFTGSDVRLQTLMAAMQAGSR